MFRIAEDSSTRKLVQCLVKNYKIDTVVSVDMDKVAVMAAHRIILVIFIQALYKAPWWWILCDPKHVGALLNIL